MIKGDELITYVAQIQLLLFQPTKFEPNILSHLLFFSKSDSKFIVGESFMTAQCSRKPSLQNKIALWGQHSNTYWTDEK